jgi:DNA-binding response OmpR family regulator
MPDAHGSLSEKRSVPTKTILIVEDDASVGQFLELAVSQETVHTPLLAATSEHALEVALHAKPDLFILDYYLDHHTTGIDLYDQLHAQPELAAVPAIILTASLEKHQPEIDQRQLVGMAKPLELDNLLLCIEQLLSILAMHPQLPPSSFSSGLCAETERECSA